MPIRSSVRGLTLRELQRKQNREEEEEKWMAVKLEVGSLKPSQKGEGN